MVELYSNFSQLPIAAYFGAAVVMLFIAIVWGSKMGKTVLNLLWSFFRGLIFVTLSVGGASALIYGLYQVYARFFAGG